jgi:hypothetical protein
MMSHCSAEDWDGRIPAEVWAEILRARRNGAADPVVVLSSSGSPGGARLLADLGLPAGSPGDGALLSITATDRLSPLLDRCFGTGVGRMVTGVPQRNPRLVRAVLVLPETIEIHFIDADADEKSFWPAGVVDLAAKRVQISDDDGESWQSFDLANPIGSPIGPLPRNGLGTEG